MLRENNPVNWQYDALLNQGTISKNNRVKLNKPYSNYTLYTSGVFTVFRLDQLTDEQASSIQRDNWKIHLSISLVDLPKAWDVIFPILARAECEHFKVTRVNEVADELHKLNEKQHKIIQADDQMRAGDQKKIDELGEVIAKEANPALRVAEGMQITIYPVPGQEWKYRLALQDIEAYLTDHGIKHGIFDAVDKHIGNFTSVRHTGFGNEGYTAADRVASYNPDNAFEVFYPLTMLNFLPDIKNISVTDDTEKNKSLRVKDIVVNNLANVSHILALHDLFLFLKSSQCDFLRKKTLSGIFRKGDNDWDTIVKAIKAQIITIVKQRPILHPAEDQAIRDILGMKRNTGDPRSPKSLDTYLKLRGDEAINVADKDTDRKPPASK